MVSALRASLIESRNPLPRDAVRARSLEGLCDKLAKTEDAFIEVFARTGEQQKSITVIDALLQESAADTSVRKLCTTPEYMSLVFAKYTWGYERKLQNVKTAVIRRVAQKETQAIQQNLQEAKNLYKQANAIYRTFDERIAEMKMEERTSMATAHALNKRLDAAEASLQEFTKLREEAIGRTRENDSHKYTLEIHELQDASRRWAKDLGQESSKVEALCHGIQQKLTELEYIQTHEESCYDLYRDFEMTAERVQSYLDEAVAGMPAARNAVDALRQLREKHAQLKSIHQERTQLLQQAIGHRARTGDPKDLYKQACEADRALTENL